MDEEVTDQAGGPIGGNPTQADALPYIGIHQRAITKIFLTEMKTLQQYCRLLKTLVPKQKWRDQ